MTGEQVVDGLDFPEGPVWLGVLLVADEKTEDRFTARPASSSGCSTATAS